MHIEFDKSTFISNFLSPITRVTEKGALLIKKDTISCICTPDSNNPIVYSTIITENDIGDNEEITLCIPDIKRLIVAINCTDGDRIKLTINSNNLEYNGKRTTFKYHLLEPNALPKEIVNRKKLLDLKYDCDFVLTRDMFGRVLKSMPFSVNTSKIYFFTKDTNVHCELTDKSIANADPISFMIAESFNGEPIKVILPIGTDIFKLFSGISNDITVKYSSANKVFLFKISDDTYTIRYIVSPMVK